MRMARQRPMGVSRRVTARAMSEVEEAYGREAMALQDAALRTLTWLEEVARQGPYATAEEVQRAMETLRTRWMGNALDVVLTLANVWTALEQEKEARRG
jgi:hypothetical protein